MVGSTSVRVETQRRDEVETIVLARTKSIAVGCLLIDRCVFGGWSLFAARDLRIIQTGGYKGTLCSRSLDDGEDVVETAKCSKIVDGSNDINKRQSGFQIEESGGASSGAEVDMSRLCIQHTADTGT